MTKRRVYLDHSATTPVDPRVASAMARAVVETFGNASSVHGFGQQARAAIDRARREVAALIGAKQNEIVFTSGGTEANNLALKGVTGYHPPSRVLYGVTDHPCVMEASEALKAVGWGVEPIAVDRDGIVRFEALAAQLERGPVRLVSVMRANNETGVIQDVKRIATMAHAADALMHVDAVQAAGKIPVDFVAWDCDLLSISSHKINGPKGIGALAVKSHVELAPQLHGGPQERGMRGGTENVPAIVGFGTAAEIAMHELAQRAAHMRALRDRVEAGLRGLPGIEVFAQKSERVPNTVQFALHGYDGEALLMQLDRKGFAVSSGSACASGKGEPSHVLIGMGIDRDTAKGAIRVSLGKDNTEPEVDQFLAALGSLAQQPAMAGAE